jgi:hypothetical protein
LRKPEHPELRVPPGARTPDPFLKAFRFLPRFTGPDSEYSLHPDVPRRVPGSQLGRQSQYALDRLPVAHPSRIAAIHTGLFEKMGDKLLLIHLDKTTKR